LIRKVKTETDSNALQAVSSCIVHSTGNEIMTTDTELGMSFALPKDLKWETVVPLDQNGKGIFVSLLHGDLQTKGPTNFLMKYSSGIKSPPHLHTGDYYAVVVSGQFRHFLKFESECEVLTAGATFFQKGNVIHQDACIGDEDCILSIFWPEGFDVKFADDQKSEAECSTNSCGR
jgi:hypothetical protein